MIDAYERAGFVAKIAERPDDDVPRLAYADLLDERSEPDRAEFIRVQCRLERITHSALCRDGCGCEVGELRRRERELLEKNRNRWHLPEYYQELSPVSSRFGPNEPIRMPPPARRVIENQLFRRGFVEIIGCAFADWLVVGDSLLAITPLRLVRFSDGGPVGLNQLFQFKWDGNPGSLLTHHKWPGVKFDFAPDGPCVRGTNRK